MTGAARWGPRLRRSARGTVVLALAALVAFAARESGNNLLTLMAAALLAATIVSKVKGRRLVAGIDLSAAAAPEGLFANRQGEIALAVASRSGPATVTLEHPALGSPRECVAEETVRRIAIPVLPRRRGPLALDGLVVRSHGPWGLTSQERRMALPHPVLVYPEPASGVDLARLIGRRRKRVEGVPVESRLPGEGSDFLMLRDHRPEDGLRRVHWRASARAGTLVTKVHEDEEPRAVTFVLHPTIPEASAAWEARFENAVSQVTSAVLQASRRGLRFTLLIPGYRHVAGEGTALLFGALAALATVTPRVGASPGAPDGSIAFAAEAQA